MDSKELVGAYVGMVRYLEVKTSSLVVSSSLGLVRAKFVHFTALCANLNLFVINCLLACVVKAYGIISSHQHAKIINRILFACF